MAETETNTPQLRRGRFSLSQARLQQSLTTPGPNVHAPLAMNAIAFGVAVCGAGIDGDGKTASIVRADTDTLVSDPRAFRGQGRVYLFLTASTANASGSTALSTCWRGDVPYFLFTKLSGLYPHSVR